MSSGRSHRPVQVSVLEKQILSYLLENPRAGETVGAIAVWWVQYKQFECSKPRVEHALSKLVKKELVLERHRPDSRETYYKLNPAMKSHVQTIVKGGKAMGP